MRRGFALIEVVLATGLVLLVGAGLTLLLTRSETASRSSEAAEAAALVIRTMALQARTAPPSWLPARVGETVALTQDQIVDILNRVPEATFTDPRLYQVRVTRQPDTPEGLAAYRSEVCVLMAGTPHCLSTDFFLAGSSRYVPPPQGAPVPPPSGRAVILLSITGPQNGLADVTAAGQTYTRYGLYVQEVAPGTVTVTARDTADSRYTYKADPQTQSASLNAGASASFSVTYACVTGAASFTIVPPPGQTTLPADTVTLTPGNTDISQGGLVPYLAPQTYSVRAADVRAGAYTYTATVSPSSSFTVTPCQTNTLTVSYAPVTGALRVVVSKPQGMAANPQVRVTGPDPSMPVALNGPALLSNLVPGSYTATPQDVLDSGVRFRGSATPSPASVQAGQTAEVQVAYAAVSARLTVELRAGGSGYPAPQVTVRGPSFNRSLTSYGTHTFDDLNPGDYTLQASPVQDNLYTYAPTPLTKTETLSAGDRKTVTMTYQPTTGALRVSVAGLPSGVTPDVRLNGSPLTFDSSGQATVPYLAPGSHNLSARNVSYGGYVYAPDPDSVSVQIREGRLTTQTVAYTRLEGTVTVSVSGLPSGAFPDATLSVPDGSVRSITRSGTTTFSGMPTGTYALTARDVTVGGITYRPTVSPSSGTLANGGTLSFSVTYAPVNGLLQVEIAGLPPRTNANVAVTNSEGYARTLTASGALTLPPGTYQVSAASVNATLSTSYGGLVYVFAPSPSSQEATVRAGQTTTVTVTYVQQKGNVNVEVRNPSSGTGQVTVTGPGGFQQSFSAPPGTTQRTFTGVPTGTYTASGSDIRADGYTWRTAAATASLAPEGTANLTLTYAASTGALEVRVTAPSGMPTPTVKLLDEQGREVGRFTGLTNTFTDLLPGSYTVRPEPVTDSQGFVYQAAAVAVNVTAGRTATASPVYVKQSAFVRVSISGLPSEAIPKVTLTGPRTVVLRAPATLELPLGAYTVTADRVSHGGYEYLATVSPNAFSLTDPGSTQSVSVVYQEASGTISLTVSGLPSGASVTVTVSGGSLVKTASCGNGACVFDRLPLGTYSVLASSYASSLYDYLPSVTPSSYEIASPSQTLSGTVTYTPVTGALTVTVSAPSGMPAPTLVLKRTNGAQVAQQTGVGALTFAHLAPGRYVLEARGVTDAQGFPYVPTPGTQEVGVSAGQTASASVTYSRQQGTLRLQVSGLPSGAAALVSLNGTVSTAVTTGNTSGLDVTLPPGTYDVAPSTYTDGNGLPYVPDPSSARVTIANGQTTSVSFAYSRRAGTLRLIVSGLPSGVQLPIQVVGPITLTPTLGNTSGADYTVPPGTYTITPGTQSYSRQDCWQECVLFVCRTVCNPSYTYTYGTSPRSWTAAVQHNQRTDVEVPYRILPGTMRVTVRNLPSGYSSTTVTVSGHSRNYLADARTTRTLTMGNGTQTVNGLAPGNYTVSATKFYYGLFSCWAPSPDASLYTVNSDGTVDATLTYSNYFICP